MYKTLCFFAAMAIGASTTAHSVAMAGGTCETSGIEVKWEFDGDPEILFERMPVEVQEGMIEHQKNLGVEPDPAHGDVTCWWHDTSYGCQSNGTFCECVKISGEWGCGCDNNAC